MFTLGNHARPQFLLNTVSFANTFGACILATRLYPSPFWREALLILAQCGLMTLNVAVIVLLFGSSRNQFSTYLSIATVGTLVIATNARLLARFWYKWNHLRQRHFLWSLTHAHLMVVEGLILSGLLAVLFIQILLFFRPSEKNGLTLVAYIQNIEPYITVGGLLTLAVLLLVLPPSALFAYVVSRQLVRRIMVLEQATALVEQGDYSVQVQVEGEDEIARLQARYNSMTSQLHQTIQKLQVEQATVAGLSKLQREMVASISHDLRTPIATLQVYLDTLVASPQTNRIKEEIDHLRRLTDDLFEAAQHESLTLTLRLMPTHIKPLLEQIVAVTHAAAQELRQVEIYSEIPADLPLILIDSDRLSQIIRNLLQNALRWTPPGGMILVRAVPIEAEVQIAVQDTGIGIAADELSNIWRRAYRVDYSQEGSGLGLAMVKQLVEAMQGRVSVESVVNSGSCFRVYFPIFKPA